MGAALEERLEGLRRQMEAVEAQGASLHRTALAVEEECRYLDEDLLIRKVNPGSATDIAPATPPSGPRALQYDGGREGHPLSPQNRFVAAMTNVDHALTTAEHGSR